MSNTNPWTRQDIDYLWKNYPHKSGKELAAHFGRSVVSIRTKAHRLGIATTQSVVQQVSRKVNPFGLSDKEVMVVRSLAEGRTVQGVCAHLSSSPTVIGDYLKSVRRRMGVYSSMRMVLKAERAGLLVGVEV